MTHIMKVFNDNACWLAWVPDHSVLQYLITGFTSYWAEESVFL